MKRGPVTKIDKGNKKTSKKIHDDVISLNCDVIVIFQFMADLEQSRVTRNYDSLKLKLPSPNSLVN